MITPAMDMNLSQPAIELRALRVAFGEYLAVADADISVARGQSFGLVGESGSGKSTVLRALCGLVPLAGGTAVLNAGGQNFALGARVPKRLRRVVQMVFQDPYGSLHPRHTVDRLLSEPLAIHGIGDRPRRVLAALDEVGLGPSFRYRYPHQLSGGQRQRIAIARALILEPEIVLLDEPTSALDASVQAEILNLLETIRRARGLTYLMVSHDLAVITHMCSRIAVMQAGRIVTTVDSADFAARRVDHPYAQALIAASEGFRKTR